MLATLGAFQVQGGQDISVFEGLFCNFLVSSNMTDLAVNMFTFLLNALSAKKSMCMQFSHRSGGSGSHRFIMHRIGATKFVELGVGFLLRICPLEIKPFPCSLSHVSLSTYAPWHVSLTK